MQLTEKYGGAIYLLWMDLETTGSDEDMDEIIEIGALLTDFELNQVGRTFSQVYQPDDTALGRLIKNDVVREMHTANGLLAECIRAKHYARNSLDVNNWLNYEINRKQRRGPVEKFRFMLAGSGVGHFDREFISRYLPDLDNLLVFAPLDVGMVRRFLKVSGVEPSHADNTDQKNHRALDDVILHLEEARAYRDWFQECLEPISNIAPTNREIEVP